LVVTALLLPGCQASYPDFLERSQQDCVRGDRDACRMLNALDPAAPSRTAPSRTQAQRNAQAILQGMEQARASRTSGAREETPSSPPDATPLESPMGGTAPPVAPLPADAP
jgi:hypothetical protein